MKKTVLVGLICLSLVVSFCGNNGTEEGGLDPDGPTYVTTGFNLSMSEEEATAINLDGVLVELFQVTEGGDILFASQVIVINWEELEIHPYIEAYFFVDAGSYFARFTLVDNLGVAIEDCAPAETPIFEAQAHHNTTFGDPTSVAVITCVDPTEIAPPHILDFAIDVQWVPSMVMFNEDSHVEYKITYLDNPVTIYGPVIVQDGTPATYAFELVEKPVDFPVDATVSIVPSADGTAKVLANHPGIYQVKETATAENGSFNWMFWSFTYEEKEGVVVEKLMAVCDDIVQVDLSGDTPGGGSTFDTYYCPDPLNPGEILPVEAFGHEFPIRYDAAGDSLTVVLEDKSQYAFLLKVGPDGSVQPDSCVGYLDGQDPPPPFLTIVGESYIAMIEQHGPGLENTVMFTDCQP
jgi:hypothetical protein